MGCKNTKTHDGLQVVTHSGWVGSPYREPPTHATKQPEGE